MNIEWTEAAWEDDIYWPENDKKKVKRINSLIKSTQRTPLEGIGKPEALKYGIKGFYSRRIDSQNRLVYTVTEECIIIVQFRYHY